MSYYQSSHYQPPPAQSPHNQYQSPPAQNGGFPAQPPFPGQPPYAEQPGYPHSSGGGAVQQPEDGYQHNYPPRGASYDPHYGAPPAQYNPQTYQPAAPQQHTPPTPYNPQAYASVGSPAYGQYNPSAFPVAQSTSGPVDPYAYSQDPYSNQPHQPSYAPSPRLQYPSPQQPYTPSPPVYHGFDAQPSPPPPPHSGYHYPTSVTQPSSIPYQPATYRPPANPSHPQRQNTISPQNPYAIPDRAPWLPSPPIYQPGYDTRGSPSPLYHDQASPGAGSTPGPTPPLHGPSRSNTLDRHPQARPLPAQPSTSYFADPSSQHHNGLEEHADYTQDDLFDEVEGMVRDHGSGGHSPAISVSQPPFTRPYPAGAGFGSQRHSRRSTAGSISGHLSPNTAYLGASEPQYSSDSDAEATQGLRLMQDAEKDDARRGSGGQMPSNGYGSQRNSRQRQEETHADDSDDNVVYDMSTIGGGFNMPMTYGDDPNQSVAGGESNGDAHSSHRSSVRNSGTSLSSRGGYEYDQGMHPFPPFNAPAAPARVDAGGTGGLAEPTGLGRRPSYDEGDENDYALGEGQLPDRFPDEPLNTRFQAAHPYRPLPVRPYPEDDTVSFGADRAPLPMPGGQLQWPNAPDAYSSFPQEQYVPRSTSLVAHPHTPQVIQPLRSKTDAEERKLRQQGYRGSMYSTMNSTPASSSMIIDLPAIGKRFVPSKLGAPDFKKCKEPWALSGLLDWLLEVTHPEQNTELKEADVRDALVALFTSKVPTMNIADAEVLSVRVVQDFFAASVLVTTEEWVKIVPGSASGVIYQLTNSGCYSLLVHDQIIPNMRCYSRLCQRTLKKVNLQAQITKSSDSWAEFYSLSKESLEGKDRKELEKQNVLHEIVSTEEGYMLSLDVLRSLYRDALNTIDPSVITPKRKEKFIREVFGRLDAVRQANEEHLLPQLKYRQEEQGPWIVGFSDIFRQWIRKARTAYVDYANDFPKADHEVRQEMDRNLEFRNFVDRARNDKRSNRLSLDSYLKAPISRLQRYALLLSTVLKNMKEDSQEKTDLQIALDEVKAVALECDARVAEMQRKFDLADLSQKLVLRPSMQNAVELNLDHFGRELIHRGDLQRMGGTRFTWLDCHALLFDHYLVLAKTVASRLEQGGKLERYDVSRLPIPMDLLILENASDTPVQRSSYVVKGIPGMTSSTTISGRTSTPFDSAPGRAPPNQSPGPPSLAHVNTGSTTNSLQTVTSQGDKDTDRILYPFTVKHLGRETYTLFASSENLRRDWCNKIIEAKTKHAAALHAQNAEPFRLRVMADSAFVLDAFGGSGKGVTIKGTPVDRAIKEVEHHFNNTGRPGPICRQRVNCATSFTTPYPGKQMVAVGTDFGVFISELDNARGWSKVINTHNVTQITVLEEFNLLLLLADKCLIYYHLDVVCPSDNNGPAPANDTARKAPQKLSKKNDIGFFVAGKMKDRTLVMFKKRENINSVFKVLEPVYQKSSEKKRGIFKRGTTEFFRDYDDFYIPSECTGMNLFHSSLAVSTARGFEVMTLDRKIPCSVPDTKAEHVSSIAQHIKEQKALSMLRLSDQEFLLCYANCAVYVNKHGDVSRSVIMEFVGNAQAAALYGPYLVLFDNDFVEVRNAQDGRLKQIIAGREVKCLDNGSSWSANPGLAQGANGAGPAAAVAQPSAPKTLKLVMQHPEMEKTQIVVELLLNENMKE